MISVPIEQLGTLEHPSKVAIATPWCRGSIESSATGAGKSIKLPCSWVFMGTARPQE